MVELSRTDSKRAAITEAATTLFLRDGYRGASMEEIATAAGVSKQTVYKQFAHKQQLFSHVVTTLVNEASDPVHEAVQEVNVAGDVREELSTIARRQLELVLRPALMQLRRLVIAETVHFPELGKVFFDQGPRRTIDALADALGGLAQRGALQIDDPKLAATHFNWLLMGEVLNRAMLLGLDQPPPPRELDRWATTAVDTFLAAFSSPRR
jgi:TetR/AcrR family transcriptional regulator, mexJK operon transcriptional repressor